MENHVPMDDDLYKAAVAGESWILSKIVSGNGEYFLRRTSETGDNIIHLATQHERYHFVCEALENFPRLSCEENSCKETPFHVAAETGNTDILNLLLTFYKAFERATASDASFPPWRVKNLEGNTPLHVALIYGNLEFATKLVKEDPKVAAAVNNYGETPLHLAIKYRVEDDNEALLATMKLAANVPEGTSMMKRLVEKDPLPIIKLLLQVNTDASCVRDANGLTPLLVAASLSKPYISTVKIILNSYPQCAKVCDSSGRTILHLLNELPKRVDREYLRKIPEIRALKNRQDFQGNTPAHVAVKNRNIFMIQLLLQMSANFAIKNKEGISAAFLVQQQIDDLQNLLSAKREEGQVPCHKPLPESARRLLDDELSAQHYTGPVRSTSLLDKITNLLEKTDKIPEPERRNLEHWLLIACYLNDGDCNYMKDALKGYLATYGTNALGSNPLQAMVRHIPEAIDNMVLEMFKHCFEETIKEAASADNLYSPPWMMKDGEGNTPLHKAVLLLSPATTTADDSQISVMLKCIIEFLKFDVTLYSSQNNNKETPLHLLSQVTLRQEDIKVITDACGCEPSTLDVPQEGFLLADKDGLTPILRAAQHNNFRVVKLLCTLGGCSSMKIRGEDGKILWHLVAEKAPFELSYPNPDLDDLLQSIYGQMPCDLGLMTMLYSADNDGDTPLHEAIEKGNFEFAQSLIDYTVKATNNEVNFLSIRNKKGVSPGDMIGSATNLPSKFESFLWSKPELVKQMLGIRSLSGVPTTMVKDYINTIGVIAALLATITFTAAFAVPGGLNPKDGTPFLMGDAAFKVFMVSDIIAMCLSMMILFCLLWIMGSEAERVVLLDLVIFLLELSFYATLVAFMTGLYVTTFPVVPWIGILACALCSLLILVMREPVITSIIRPAIKLVILSRRVASLFGEFLYLLLCTAPKEFNCR